MGFLRSTMMASCVLFPVVSAFAQTSQPQHYEATLVARDDAVLSAPMNGRLERFPFHDGDVVQKGDVVARYVCAAQEAQMARSLAAEQKAASLMDLQNRSVKDGYYTTSDVRASRGDYAVAKAELGVSRAAVQDCSVLAPFQGVVGSVSAKNYQFTQIGAPLLRLLGTQSYEVSVLIPSTSMSLVQKQTPFQVYVNETGKTYKGHYTRISGLYDAVGRMVHVYGSLDDQDASLRSGMTGVIKE